MATEQKQDLFRNIPPEILEKLDQGVSSITDSDSFRNYLTAQSRFWSYSPNNTLLIMVQDPQATRVASYDTWKSLKRQVQKGEKGTKVFYPVFRKFPWKNEDTGEVEEVKKLVSFGLGNVFDVRQTAGKPLPTPPEVPVLDSDAGEDLFLRMNTVAHRENLRVKAIASDIPNPDLMGWYEPANNLIALRDNVPMLQKTKTLAHELSHFYHGPIGLLTSPRDEQETIAESSAYVTLARYGLDSGERSFPYLAIWAQDKDVLRRALGSIQRVSSTLIGKIDQVQPANPIAYPSMPAVAERMPGQL